ncbi:putative Alpha/beta hydrolase fold-1 [Seiridium cardinale]
MSSSKPVFLLACGGWHAPAAYEKLKVELERKGYEYHCPHLPSLGPNASGVTYEADVEEFRKVALPLFDQGKDIILIAHSAGGVPAVVASEGLEVGQRGKDGKKGGFKQIIFIAAVIIPVRGSDTLHTLGGSWQPGQGGVEPYTKNNLMTLSKGAEKALYSDLPHEEAEKYYDLFESHSQDAFETPVNYIAADVTIPMTYIVTEKDMAFPAFAQKALAASLSGIKIESIETSHSPFASQPGKLAELILKIASES